MSTAPASDRPTAMHALPFPLLAAILLPVLALAPLATASARDNGWVHLDYSQVRLVSAQRGVGAGARVRLGLQIRMRPGFKTYWRSPGDAGIPPRLDWSGSSNLARAQVRWPAPQRFVLAGFNTFGYAEEVVLPIDAELDRPGRPLAVKLHLVYGVCRDICVLGEADLALTVPAGEDAASGHAELIAWFRAQVPAPSHADVDISRVQIIQEGGSRVLDIAARARGGAGFDRPDIIVEGLEGVALPQPLVAVGGRERRDLRVRYPLPGGLPDLAGREVTLTLLDSALALETRARIARGAGPTPPAPSGGR